ncbi:MAG TPA: DUF4173 domain-containing protein [Actinopolymorphaceae bacterium]|jgi:hypothetical protein
MTNGASPTTERASQEHPQGDQQEPAGAGSASGSAGTSPLPPRPYVPPLLFTPPEVPDPPRWILPAIASAGLVAALAVPYAQPGIGVMLAATTVGIAVAPVLGPRLDGWSATVLALGYGLVTLTAVRDATWLLPLSLLAAFLLGALVCARTPHSWLGVIRGGLSVVWASGHVPWFLAKAAKQASGWRRMAPVLVGVALAVFLLLVFGVLFASADAVFGEYLLRLLSIQMLQTVPERGFAFVVTAGVTAAAILVALREPKHTEQPVVTRQTVAVAVWFIPLTALNVLFVSFILLQLSVLFGGQRQVLQTAGLTYAEYARSGFFQLVTISVIVLGIVALVSATLKVRGPYRLVIAGELGLLCGLTLVVLASAWLRLSLYVDVYGWSRLRASVGATIWWLAAIFALVLVAGAIRTFAGAAPTWLPRSVVVVTAAGLLAFGAWNPDLRIAQTHIAARQAEGLDVVYLRSLSADAVPALVELPEPIRRCVLHYVVVGSGLDKPEPWNGWNLSRSSARRHLGPELEELAKPVDYSECFDERTGEPLR